ncbi:TRI15 protein, partial [Paradoxornis webbianus]|nr:TRI15 protein [Sinosuthora webbiana]
VKEQQKMLLGQLHQLSKEIVEKWETYNTTVLERALQLDVVITKIEEKQGQTVVKFLMDVDNILTRCEAARVPIPLAVFPELQRSVCSISEMIHLVVDMVTKFRVDLQSEIDGKREKVTLDPETAGPFVVLSQDHKTIRWRDGNQNLPDVSERFTSNAAVLGSQG